MRYTFTEIDAITSQILNKLVSDGFEIGVMRSFDLEDDFLRNVKRDGVEFLINISPDIRESDIYGGEEGEKERGGTEGP